MVVAPAIRAPCRTLRPTPPQPMTATLSPGCTPALKRAAPTPVVTLQPMSAIWGKSRPTGAEMQPASVSYTHLTLPTILLV